MRFAGKTYSPVPTEPGLPPDCTANPSLWANVWNLQALEKRHSSQHHTSQRNETPSPVETMNNNYNVNNFTDYYYCNNGGSNNNTAVMGTSDAVPRLLGVLGGGRRAVLQKSISVDSKITSQRIMLLPSRPPEARRSPSCSPTIEEYPMSVKTPGFKPRSLECHFDLTRRGTRTVVKSVSLDTPTQNIESRPYRSRNNAPNFISNVVFNGTYPIDVPVDHGLRFSAPTTPY